MIIIGALEYIVLALDKCTFINIIIIVIININNYFAAFSFRRLHSCNKRKIT